jgi:predicted ester cyclase
MTESAERNKAIVRALVEAVNARNWDRIDRLVMPSFVRHSHAAGQPGVRSRDDLKRFLRSEYETFPDAHETLEDLFGEGDRVAARHRFRGTQSGPLGPYPPTGRVMTADYLAIYRLEGGRVAEAWAEWDNLSGLAQLGHHQPPA